MKFAVKRMGFNEIVKRILSARQDLTLENVLELIESKKIESEGYFTDEGAARVVASELRVEVIKKTFQPEVLIQDLVSGLRDVTIKGRVMVIYPSLTFTHPSKKEGKVARMLIADKSGMLMVVLWDDKVSLLEDGVIKQGQIIKILHGYVRERLNGKLELHIGSRGDIQISPPVTKDSDYPLITHFLQKIGMIVKNTEVCVMGVVELVHPVFTFERRDGTIGKGRRLLLRDDTSQITVVSWDKKVDEIEDVKSGSYIRIIDARVRESNDGRLEIHTKNTTKIEKLIEHPNISFTGFTKIGELKPDMSHVKVVARVIHIGGIREFKRRSGEIGYLSTLLLKDETGFVHLNLWDEKSALSRQVQIGDVALVERSYVRERFGRISLNIGNQGGFTLNPNISEADKLPSLEDETTVIAEVREKRDPITVEGTIASKPIIKEVFTSRGERVAVASFELSDDTGEIRVSLWRELVKNVMDLPVGKNIKIKWAYVREGLSGQLELTSRFLTSIET